MLGENPLKVHVLLSELQDTLATDQLELTVDMFTFDWKVCPEQLAIGRCQRHLDDFAYGAEPVPIRAVNNVDEDPWPTVTS